MANKMRDMEAGLAAIRRGGSSPDSVSSGGFSGAGLQAVPPYMRVKITGRQNHDEDDDTKLACYSYVLMSTRNPVIDTEGDGVQRILYEKEGAYVGDFARIDPDADPDDPNKAAFPPAFETSGNANVPVDGTAIVALWPAVGGGHYWFEWHPEDTSTPLIPATLLRAKKGDLDDLIEVWRYSYTLDSYDDNEKQVQGEITGTVPYDIQTVHTQTHDGINPDIWTTTITGATAGSYVVTDDGSPTGDIAWNATSGTVSAALSHFTAVVVVDTSGAESLVTIVFTATNTSPHTISVDSSEDNPLQPDTPHYPAIFRNNVKMDTPVAVHLKNAFNHPPKLKVTTTQKGDGDSDNGTAGTKPTIFKLEVIDRRDGQFRLLFDTVHPSPTDPNWKVIERDDDAAAIQTKLSTLLTCTVTEDPESTVNHRIYIITVTADNDSHKLRTDRYRLTGRTYYVVVWSNGNECTGPIGGVDPTGIDGYGASAPTITVTPSGSSVGPWNISVTHATSGTWQIKVDGGGTVDTTLGTAPVLGGFAITTGTDGSYHLIGDGSAHTIEAFSGKLRNNPDYAVIVHLRCAKLEEIADCGGA